jgi:MYXO-CTERM domain-containing protein
VGNACAQEPDPACGQDMGQPQEDMSEDMADLDTQADVETPQVNSGGGGGCASAPGRASGPWWLLGLLALWGVRRRQ